MSSLFDTQTLEFFCAHQTPTESKQLIQWASNEISKKIKSQAKTKETRRFLTFVRQQVLDYLKAIFNGKGDDGDYNTFVDSYTRLWKLCLPSEDKAAAATQQQIILRIQQREEKRLFFLQKQIGQPKIADFVKWFESESRASGEEFNMIVSGFVEQLTQTILEKGVNVLLFPNTDTFIH